MSGGQKRIIWLLLAFAFFPQSLATNVSFNGLLGAPRMNSRKPKALDLESHQNLETATQPTSSNYSVVLPKLYSSPIEHTLGKMWWIWITLHTFLPAMAPNFVTMGSWNQMIQLHQNESYTVWQAQLRIVQGSSLHIPGILTKSYIIGQCS